MRQRKNYTKTIHSKRSIKSIKGSIIAPVEEEYMIDNGRVEAGFVLFTPGLQYF